MIVTEYAEGQLYQVLEDDGKLSETQVQSALVTQPNIGFTVIPHVQDSLILFLLRSVRLPASWPQLSIICTLIASSIGT